MRETMNIKIANLHRYFLTLMFLLFIPSCMFMKPEALNIIPSHDLHQLMEKEDVFLVDVHIPEQDHIIGTDLFVPFHKIEENLNKFPKDKETPIYLYCESGPMGNYAARTLLKAGYLNIYNLEGGTHAWKDSGYSFKKIE